jgi:NADH-quinone oxidoreductase subunit I
MGALTNRAKVLEQKPMSFLERLYLPAILKGMAVTFTHMFKKKATINYPEEKRPFSPVFRGLHVLNRDAEGRENCTACGLCAVACPAEAITMEAAERQSNEEHLYREEKYAAKYAFSAVSAKRLVPKMPSIFLRHLLLRISPAKDLFIQKTNCSFPIQ